MNCRRLRGWIECVDWRVHRVCVLSVCVCVCVCVCLCVYVCVRVYLIVLPESTSTSSRSWSWPGIPGSTRKRWERWVRGCVKVGERVCCESVGIGCIMRRCVRGCVGEHGERHCMVDVWMVSCRRRKSVCYIPPLPMRPEMRRDNPSVPTSLNPMFSSVSDMNGMVSASSIAPASMICKRGWEGC